MSNHFIVYPRGADLIWITHLQTFRVFYPIAFHRALLTSGRGEFFVSQSQTRNSEAIQDDLQDAALPKEADDC